MNKDIVCGKVLPNWTKLYNRKIMEGCPPNAGDVTTNVELMNTLVDRLFFHQIYLVDKSVKELLVGWILVKCDGWMETEIAIESQDGISLIVS